MTLLQKEEQVEFQGKNVALYVGGAFAFGLGIWATLGSTKAEEYFAGYLLEQSLSVDNLFVFILVFNYFKTPVEAQSKVNRVSVTRCSLICQKSFAQNEGAQASAISPRSRGKQSKINQPSCQDLEL